MHRNMNSQKLSTEDTAKSMDKIQQNDEHSKHQNRTDKLYEFLINLIIPDDL